MEVNMILCFSDSKEEEIPMMNTEEGEKTHSKRFVRHAKR